MAVTLCTELISSWCHWAEPAWAELERELGGRAVFPGIATVTPLLAAAQALLVDEDFARAHHGDPPPA